jgi:hypothetical protein
MRQRGASLLQTLLHASLTQHFCILIKHRMHACMLVVLFHAYRASLQLPLLPIAPPPQTSHETKHSSPTPCRRSQKKKTPCRQISQHPKRRFEASIACRATSCSPSLDIIPRSRVAARRHQDHAQSMMINTQKSIFYSWFVTDR